MPRPTPPNHIPAPRLTPPNTRAQPDDPPPPPSFAVRNAGWLKLLRDLLVTFIGVLLALAANNWWHSR